MSEVNIYAYNNGRGPRIVVEISGQDVVFDVKRATQLRDALTRKLEEIAAGPEAPSFAGCCNKWRVGQSGPCVLEPNHDGGCLGRTGTTMGG